MFDLKKRIAILEERLCPFNGHEWEELDKELKSDGKTVAWRILQCKRCGRLWEGNMEKVILYNGAEP